MTTTFKPAPMCLDAGGYRFVDPFTVDHRVEGLPAGIYDLNVSRSETGTRYGLGPRKSTHFDIPDTIYGFDHPDCLVDIHLNLRNETQGGMGIALVGNKGSGKTLEAKYISNVLMEENDAVCIWVTEAIDELTIRSLSSVAENVIFFFDEFDRKYPVRSDDRLDQEDILSVLSDNYPNNVTFLLTANTELSEYYQNRTKRIMSYVRYRPLEKHVLEGVLEKHPLPLHYELYVRLMFYIRANVTALNVDVLLQVIDTLTMAPSAKEAMRYLSALNIPNTFYPGVKLFVPAIKENQTVLLNEILKDLDSEEEPISVEATAEVLYYGGELCNLQISATYKGKIYKHDMLDIHILAVVAPSEDMQSYLSIPVEGGVILSKTSLLTHVPEVVEKQDKKKLKKKKGSKNAK